jgi:hypothetical protein
LSTEVLLFVLRVISAILLLSLLGALFLVIWRDYHSTVHQVKESRRSYGQLIALREIDGNFILTGDVYPLLPLTSMGRSPTNTVQITRRSGQWWLEDRRSRNGTTLNGLLVNRPVIVTNGDIIGVGTMRYRIELEG